MTREQSGEGPPSVRFGSWGVLVIEGETAHFLWFDGAEEMATGLMSCCYRRRRSFDGNPTLDEAQAAYEEGKLHILTLLSRLVDALEATTGPRLILWWGPLYDLAYSETRVPMAVRSWFRQRQSGPAGGTGPSGPLESDETDSFAQFVENISFGVNPTNGDLGAY